MILKLKAIIKIIFSEHFLVMTASGFLIAVYPKHLHNLNIIQKLAEDNNGATTSAKGEGNEND